MFILTSIETFQSIDIASWSICSSNTNFEFLFKVYFLSKIWEYLDIFIVSLTGYPINLHFRIHHNTTLLLAYCFLQKKSFDAVLFMMSNLLMHFLLYLHIGGWTSWRISIRIVGHLQLIVGLVSTLIAIYARLGGEACSGDSWHDGLIILLYVVYFVLFRKEIADEERKAVKVR